MCQDEVENKSEMQRKRQGKDQKSKTKDLQTEYWLEREEEMTGWSRMQTAGVSPEIAGKSQ